MATVTVSSKGQVVLPREWRRKQGIAAGTRLEVEASGNELILRPAKKGKTVTVDDCVGIIPNTVGPVPIEEMDGAKILAKYGGKRPL